jgi:hypothetical protein
MIIVKRRSRNIHHQLRILLNQFIHRANPVQGIVAQVPDVFTNGQCNAGTLERYTVPLKGGLKISVLIKNIVGWQ